MDLSVTTIAMMVGAGGAMKIRIHGQAPLTIRAVAALDLRMAHLLTATAARLTVTELLFAT